MGKRDHGFKMIKKMANPSQKENRLYTRGWVLVFSETRYARGGTN